MPEQSYIQNDTPIPGFLKQDPLFLSYLEQKKREHIVELAEQLALAGMGGVKWPKTQQWVYHATPSYNKASIAAEGLRPGSFYARTPQEALPFAQRGRPLDPDRVVVYAVPVEQVEQALPREVLDEWGRGYVDAGIYLNAKNAIKPLIELEYPYGVLEDLLKTMK